MVKKAPNIQLKKKKYFKLSRHELSFAYFFIENDREI